VQPLQMRELLIWHAGREDVLREHR